MVNLTTPELQILGCLAVNPARIPEAVEALGPSDFGTAEGGVVYTALVGIHDRGADPSSVDLLIQALGSTSEAHGMVRQVHAHAGTVALLPGHIATVREVAKLRRIADAARRMQAEAEAGIETAMTGHMGESERVLEQASSAIFSLADRVDSASSADMVDAMRDAAALARERHEDLRAGRAPAWLSTGLDSVDRLTTGYQRGAMYVLGAGSGEGKTALATYIAVESARRSRLHTLYISVEVGPRALGLRRLSTAAVVSGERIRMGTVNDAEVDRMLMAMKTARGELAGPGYRGLVTVEHKPRATVAFVRRRVQQYIRRGIGAPLGLVVVDYVQRLIPETRRGSREQEVADMSAELLAVAQEFDCPVLVLAQLNRERNKRGDKRPQCSDLRESSALEHDAHRVDFLFRPSLYEEGVEADSRGWEPAMYLTRKHRDGRTGQVSFAMHPSTGAFRDAPPDNFQPTGNTV